MPTYEYECQKCGHLFEAVQSIKAAPLKTCPECKGRVKRLLSTGGGLLFKGSGFHVTDYRKPGYKEAHKKESGSTGTEAASSKPATATAPAKKKD